ncbi:MAG TPA: ornithine carbamoyltransferase [Caldisericia bacterium]|nr:ornithine carbamoyltransferase [Caldisericia bacterium]HOU08369.1 ornithine carbamoyltransferase [Caldisericia bacterium]HPL89167.1 ornithine carbamoyltransferase [Caldisericia bacterium]HQG60124.1 ornithine carbamoyltransferase [Caldisericia bacterium]HQH48492.1 ornithine carbamoyltransferase [Caldisericia bacterium]
MAINMKGKSVLSIHDLTIEEVEQIFDVARTLKLERMVGKLINPILAGKTLAMIFEKPSTRTRLSFDIAMHELGGHPIYLSSNDLQLARGESIADTAKVLSRYVHGIMARVFQHQKLVDLARYGSVPVVNGLSDLLHPCQVLADLFTVREKFGSFCGRKLVYMGDGANNMANSLIEGCAKVGMDCVICTPKGDLPDKTIWDNALQDAELTGATIEVSHDPIEAVQNSDVIYSDVWASMGQEAEHAERVKRMMPYQVTPKLMEVSGGALFMHCLPAHRGEEVVDEVVDAPYSIVFDEAENRLHVQKAVLALVL